MDFTIKEHKHFNKKSYNYFVLGTDVGGTNTSFGIFGVKKKIPELLLSFHFKTKKILKLHYAVNEVLDYNKKKYAIEITKACFGVAGVMFAHRSRAKITNGELIVEKKTLLKNTKLRKIMIINDFEAIGYGINLFYKKDIEIIKSGSKVIKAPIVVVGAGTGLGKTTLIYDENSGFYIPMPSEAGHTDFPAQGQNELELANFIKKFRKIKGPVSYEDVLSGQGLENIYFFLKKTKKFRKTKYMQEIDKAIGKPELISKYKNADRICKKTFETFKIIYARFAKNFALDAVAWGGVYISGGIAAKNKEIFDEEFIKIFESSNKMGSVLKKIPVYLISHHHNPGLLGAGFAAAKFL